MGALTKALMQLFRETKEQWPSFNMEKAADQHDADREMREELGVRALLDYLTRQPRFDRRQALGNLGIHETINKYEARE
jgi:hypothetical protein